MLLIGRERFSQAGPDADVPKLRSQAADWNHQLTAGLSHTSSHDLVKRLSGDLSDNNQV